MRFIAISCLFAAFSSAAEVRLWTGVQNRTIEAEMLRVEDSTVVLKLQDGREVRFLPNALASTAVFRFERG